MRTRVLVLGIAVFAGVVGFSAARADCFFTRSPEGALLLSAGTKHFLEVEIPNGSRELQAVKQVCDATFRAVTCTAYALAQDEYIQGEHDGFGVTPTVNLGRDRARLAIGYLEPWIAQFAAENYEDDQGGVYASMDACQYNRSRIAIEAAEASHEVFLDQQRDRERAERMKNYSPNFHGLKH